MDIELKSWFYDISNAISEIETFLKEVLTFSDYQKDL
jgi:hypothetical protein